MLKNEENVRMRLLCRFFFIILPHKVELNYNLRWKGLMCIVFGRDAL